MPHTNSWLCIYAIGQLGKPYLMGTAGEIRESTQSELYQHDYVDTSPNWYDNPNYDKMVKHHDCSGLIVGALTCDTVDGEPTGTTSVYHGSNTQFYGNCRPYSESMTDFPYLPGTLVFHTNDEGIKSHVGIYVGTFVDLAGVEHTDAVIEAKGRNWGVLMSSITNSKWDSWGQLYACEKDTTFDTKFDARKNGIGGQFQINTEAMTPFVATPSPSYRGKIDYDKIRKVRISAMMFFGGELFDMGHNKQTYINKNLAALVQDCNDAGMPFAIYVNVKAKNEIEADAECRALYYILAHYPPKLGIWLSLQTNNNKETNDKILEIYYKYIEKWGFKAKCGLYLDEKMLNKITWTSFQDRFYLWLIKSMPVTDIDDELLQPEMFEVPD